MQEYGPLQLIPPGLLGFLQLKNAGKSPSELSSLLQSTMELRDWFFQSTFEQVIQTATITNGSVGFNLYTTPIIVPSGEYWWVHSYAVHVGGLIATDTVSFAPGFRLVQGGANAQYSVGVPQPLITGTAATRQGAAYVNDGWFVAPGTEFGIRVMANETLGAGLTYTGQLRFTRLRI